MESEPKIIRKNLRSKLIRPLLVTALILPAFHATEAHAVDLPISPITNSASLEPASFQDDYLHLPIIFETVSSEEEIQQDPKLLKLETYLSSLQVDEDRLRQIVAENDIFAGFKHFTTEQRVDDFNRYFPIYRAADLKYGIPWALLLTIHADETAVSRDPNLNQGEQVGAMQIDKRYDQYLKEAITGWEFLEDLPNLRDPKDCEEIFKAALYIRNRAEQIKELYGPQISDIDAVLKVVGEYYSAPQYGNARVNQYLKIRSLFD